MTMVNDDKHKKRLGRAGEKQAAAYLKRAGYKILERNMRTPFGEVDIVAMRGDVIAFCEVKTRLSDDFGSPGEAVGPDKKRRYINAATMYTAKKYPDFVVRFDVIEIYMGELNHIENAFYKGDGINFGWRGNK